MMPMPNVSFDVYRGFGGSLQSQANAGNLVPIFGRLPAFDTTNFQLVFTHYLEFADSIDVRDGWTRTATNPYPTYADGDEVRITGPEGNATVYVVVYVETRGRGSPQQHKRAYLLRHSVTWPGP